MGEEDSLLFSSIGKFNKLIKCTDVKGNNVERKKEDIRINCTDKN